MTDKPDSWRSVGQVLDGMLHRGELGPSTARQDPAAKPSAVRQYCALSDDLCVFELAWLANHQGVALSTVHWIALGIHDAITNRRAVIEMHLEDARLA